MTLLQKRDRARQQRRLELRLETRRRLKEALSELVPGHKVIVFGSLNKPGVFNPRSDVDVALPEDESGQIVASKLMSDLSEKLRRPVDVVRLDRCRFRAKILREGEVWIA